MIFNLVLLTLMYDDAGSSAGMSISDGMNADMSVLSDASL